MTQTTPLYMSPRRTATRWLSGLPDPAPWAWALRTAKLLLHAVITPDGSGLDSPNEVGKCLRAYWTGVLVTVDEDLTCAGRLLETVVSAPDNNVWTIPKDKFDQLVASKRASAPGPDGISHTAFSSCSRARN